MENQEKTQSEQDRKNNSLIFKKKLVLKFLKENKNRGFSLTQISNCLFTKLNYSNKITTRVSISHVLNELLKDDLIYFRESKDGRGSIPTKIWMLKDLENLDINNIGK